MKQSGFIAIPVMGYVVAGLVLVSGVTGYGLYLSIQKQGELKTVIRQRDADLMVASKAYDDLSNERKKVEIITLDNIEVKTEIIKEVVKYRDRVKEIVRDAPPNDCLVTDLPDNLKRLFPDSDDNETRENLPAPNPNAGHESTVDAGQDLRGSR